MRVLQRHTVHSVVIQGRDFPRLLPRGSRCDFEDIPLSQLRPGDVVITPAGKLRRILEHCGHHFWVTDESGQNLEQHCWKGSLYRARVDASGTYRWRWWLTSLWNRLRRPFPTLHRAPTQVFADPRLLWHR